MDDPKQVVREHVALTRRYFLGLGAAGAASLGASSLLAAPVPETSVQDGALDSVLDSAVAKLSYLTPADEFRFFGRGNPPPHTLPSETLRAVGLHRDTWQLEVVADPDSNAEVGNPLTGEQGNALDWSGLMKLAESRAERVLHVVTCTNGRAPCGMGLWEGVPLRDVVWMAKPTGNVRRVFYYGYHNDDPKQRFQSSLPIGRVLEDPPGEHPVLLCYKLNDQWLTPAGGGPVRMIVPDRYGNLSVKWLQRIVLTNSFQANDTYAEWNNDTDSHLKTCARFLHVPERVAPGKPIAVTGLAQVGMSGLERVQYWLCPRNQPLPADDPDFTSADWRDAPILPPPDDWGGGLEGGILPPTERQVDTVTGRPHRWPLRGTIAHWAVLLQDVPPGQYDLRCRTIDASGNAQPMPRPFKKSGNVTIQKVSIQVG